MREGGHSIYTDLLLQLNWESFWMYSRITLEVNPVAFFCTPTLLHPPFDMICARQAIAILINLKVMDCVCAFVCVHGCRHVHLD